MKKNKAMRLASMLFVLTLLTTCVISGTFAKYTTKDSASDTARVAKWGVNVTATGGLFSKNYLTSTNTKAADDATTGISVQSSTADGADGKNLVAPGTKNDTGLTFSITGTPEVAVNVKFGLTVNNDVFLKAIAANGAYKDYTSNKAAGTFTLANDYYPVKFTLKKGGTVVQYKKSETETVDLSDVNLATLKAGIEALSNTSVAPNTDLSSTYGTYTLTWAWAYGNATSDAGNDQADTLLGNLANDSTIAAKTADSTATTVAWGTLTKGTDYNTDIGLQLDISVTQVD
jgi:hypothetical protein